MHKFRPIDFVIFLLLTLLLLLQNIRSLGLQKNIEIDTIFMQKKCKDMKLSPIMYTIFLSTEINPSCFIPFLYSLLFNRLIHFTWM